MKTLFVDGSFFHFSNDRQPRDRTRMLQIICFGNDSIMKNILVYPIYHTDGHRYSAFSYGLEALDVDLRASRIMVLRYMYPMNHGRIEGVKIERETTLYDLYSGNISIPWIEMRISRIATRRNSIYLRFREKNTYEGHIEFRLSLGRAPMWTPGRLTLMAFVLLTSPIYEKMVDDGVIIKELSIEVRYLGSQDTHDPLILPKLCNDILSLLRRAISENRRKIVVLTALAEEIRIRFLVGKSDGDSVIHIDILPLILEQSGRKIYGAPMKILDTLVEFIGKYRLELMDSTDM